MDKKKTTLSTKVLEEEATRIKLIANAKGLTVSDLIRRSILSIPVPERMSPEKLSKKNKVFRKYLSEVNKIGANVNQIARHCNKYREIDGDILSLLIDIEDDLKKLLELIYQELTR